MQPNYSTQEDLVKTPKAPREVPDLHYNFSNGDFSKWDQPDWVVDRVDSKYFFRSASEAARRRYNKQIQDFDHSLLETIARFRAMNEDQVRRYYSLETSNSRTSNRIRKLEEYGLIEKRKFKGEKKADTKYPAIITLTDMGKDYIRLTTRDHTLRPMGQTNFLYSPRLPIQLVSSNEIRLQLVEYQASGKWEDHVQIEGFGPLHCVGEIRLPNYSFNFIIERISNMSKKVDDYLFNRIEKYLEWAEEGRSILEDGHVILFLVPATQTIKEICQNYDILKLNEHHPVWFLSHEDLFSEKGITQGIIEIEEGKKSLKRLVFPLFKK